MSYFVWCVTREFTSGQPVLRVARTTQAEPIMGPAAGDELTLVVGGDDHLYWRVTRGLDGRSSVSRAMDSNLESALMWWAGGMGMRVALTDSPDFMRGGSALAVHIIRALGADPWPNTAVFKGLIRPFPTPLIAGETLVDWDAERWVFGDTRTGHAVWDRADPRAPVRQFPPTYDGILAMEAAIQELVLGPIIESTVLTGRVLACAVTSLAYVPNRSRSKEPERWAALAHHDTVRDVFSSFECGDRVRTATSAKAGSLFGFRVDDPSTPAGRVEGRRLTNFEEFLAGSACRGAPGTWIEHPSGGDRSLPALAAWARRAVLSE